MKSSSGKLATDFSKQVDEKAGTEPLIFLILAPAGACAGHGGAGQSPACARPVPASVTMALHVTGWSPMGLRTRDSIAEPWLLLPSAVLPSPGPQHRRLPMIERPRRGDKVIASRGCCKPELGGFQRARGLRDGTADMQIRPRNKRLPVTSELPELTSRREGKVPSFLKNNFLPKHLTL